MHLPTRVFNTLAQILPGLLVAFLLMGCGQPLHRQQAYVFGTLVEVTVYGEDAARARQATDRVLHVFDALHRDLHAWQPSDLERLNARLAEARPGAPVTVEVSPELAGMLADAARLSARGDGLFKPAVGNLVRLWGFHADSFEARLPDPAAVARLVAARPAMTDLVIAGRRVTGRNPAVRLDLGGYAKGYALDRAGATLKALGVQNALVNIGGNILALGDKGGSPWRVGIQHPRQAGALAMLELGDGEAIGTSGDYQRFFEFGGRRYCHLIDPRTGQPARGSQAVTVLTRGPGAGTLSDVASKPLFIAGPDAWQPLARRLGVAEVLVVAADGRLSATRTLAGRLHWDVGAQKGPPPDLVITD